MNFTRNKPLIVTIVVLVILILLMVATATSNSFSEKTTIVGSPFVPLQTFFYDINEKMSAAFSGTDAESAEDNAALASELDEYKVMLNNYHELQAEYQRLAELLEYKTTHQNQQLVVGRVTGKEPGNWFDVFTINLGSQDGVREQMPVITADGLVGRVEEVGLNWSKVMAIIDGRSNVPIIMERTRDVGVAGGSLGGDDLSRLLTMNYLPLDSDIVEGDVVVTSGLGGVFPKGIVVGSVVSTTTTDGGINVMIEPNVDFRRLEEVMVVIASDDPTAVVEDDIADPGASVTPIQTDDEEGSGDETGDEGGAAG